MWGGNLPLRKQPRHWLSRGNMFSGWRETHTHTHKHTPSSMAQVSVVQTSDQGAHHEINFGIKITFILMTWNSKAETWNRFFKISECEIHEARVLFNKACFWCVCVCVCVCSGSLCKMCRSWLYLLSGRGKSFL